MSTRTARRPPQSFDTWWKDLLRREGISQEEAARRVGVSKNTSQRWASGETTPRYKELVQILNAFGELPFGVRAKGRYGEHLIHRPNPIVYSKLTA